MFPSGKDAPRSEVLGRVVVRTSLPLGRGGPGKGWPGADGHFSDLMLSH